MNKEKLKKKAFTLAETLLTLTIIGVLMAVMLRSISRVNPDKDKILFLKSYHSIEAAVANTINDPSKYDQTTQESGDFSNDPLNTAYAKIDGSIYCSEDWQATESTNITCGSTPINQDNALCYFLAEQLNIIGGFSCTGGSSELNFRTTNGVCFYGWSNFGSDSITGRVDPTCNDKGYGITVYKEGKMTVPSSAQGVEAEMQEDAVRWMEEQTQIKN